ncbi:MAG: potassium/proton antiporter [Bdellovibrionales bacterium]|nr:potassium/proton antiporter [Bdellovibrionales bacterium]
MGPFEYYLIAGALLLIISVFTSKATARIGVPSLLVFIAIGMLAGSEGIGKIYFDNAHAAESFGIIALAFILFAGGLSTELKVIRPILWHGTSMGTIAVFITCVLTGAFAKYVLGFEWLEGLLLGAIISSTDAAAVFMVLRGRSIGLKGRIQPLLEFESGANDPMAVLLTVGLLQLMTSKLESPVQLIPEFIKALALGAAFGYFSGKGIQKILNRLKLEADGLYPVVTMAFVVLIFSITQALHGSGFLAVYLMGLILGNETFIHKKSLILFHDGIAWLMQIGMFLLLGLLVYPSKLVPIADSGLLISGFLILIARPIAVFVSLFGTDFNWREKAMISWVGLRGSVPIILATYPLLADIEKADLIFNLIFFIVLTSVMLQGTTIGWIAKLLKVEAPSKTRFRFPIEYAPTGTMKNDLVEIDVPAQSFGVGKSIVDLKLPKEGLIVLVQRKGSLIVPRGSTHLASGDTLLVLAEKKILSAIQKIIQKGHPEES